MVDMEPIPFEAEPETRALRRLQSAMADADAALARRMAMHPTDLAAMAHLGLAPEPVGPGELAHRLDISPAAATELVDRLTAAGHVERHRDLADRRRIRLEPSETAMRDVLGRIAGLMAALDEAARAAPPEERAAIARYLDRATAAYAAWADRDHD